MKTKTVISTGAATLSVFKEAIVTSRLKDLFCQVTVQKQKKH